LIQALFARYSKRLSPDVSGIFITRNIKNEQDIATRFSSISKIIPKKIEKIG